MATTLNILRMQRKEVDHEIGSATSSNKPMIFFVHGGAF